MRNIKPILGNFRDELVAICIRFSKFLEKISLKFNMRSYNSMDELSRIHFMNGSSTMLLCLYLTVLLYVVVRYAP